MHNPPIFIANFGAHYSLGGCVNFGTYDVVVLLFWYFLENFVSQTTFTYFHLFIGSIFVISFPIDDFGLNLINVSGCSFLYYSILAFSGDLGIVFLKIGQVRFCFDSQI